MKLETYQNCMVQIHVDDANRRTVSIMLSKEVFDETAGLLGYKVQGDSGVKWFEAPMTRDRLKLQFVKNG